MMDVDTCENKTAYDLAYLRKGILLQYCKVHLVGDERSANNDY